MEFKVDVQYNGHELGVEGTVDPIIPAQAPTLNDPGSPAEGGEIEVKDIYMHMKSHKFGSVISRRLPRAVVDHYNADERFNEIVYRAIDAMGE